MRLLVVALLLGASSSHASDQAILGKVLVLKSPADATKRRVIAKARELATPNTVVGDPTVDGATLTITVDGGTPGSAVFPLPQGTSTSGASFWSGDAVKGFRYSDRRAEAGPVKTVRLKLSGGRFQIKADVDGRGAAVLPAPPDPGTSGCVLLALGGGDTYSVQFADGSVTNLGGALFRVSKPLTEGVCATGGGTTTTTLPSGSEGPNAITFGSTSFDDAVAVAVDASGNEIVCGTFRARMTVQGVTIDPSGPSDAYLAKVAPNGALVWLRRYGGPGDDYCLAVAVDPAGDVVAGGQFTGAGTVGGASFTNHGGVDLWIGKFSGADGGHVWSGGFGGPTTDALNALATDAGGNVWATGFFDSSIDFGGATLTTPGGGDLDCFLVKLTAAGAHAFSTNFPGGTGHCQGRGVAVDASGVHLAGAFTNAQSFGGATLTSANGLYDAFVATFTSAGAHVWSLRLGNANGDDSADAVAAAGGIVYVAGYVTGDVDFGGGNVPSLGSQDGYVLKLGPTGAFGAVRRLGGSGNDYVSGVAVEPGGNVVIGGSFESTADFGSGTTLVAQGRDGFLAKYTSGLAATSWKAKRFGGTGSEWTRGVAAAPSGFDVAVGYSSSGTMNLDGAARTSAGANDGWASRVVP